MEILFVLSRIGIQRAQLKDIRLRLSLKTIMLQHSPLQASISMDWEAGSVIGFRLIGPPISTIDFKSISINQLKGA